MSEVDPTDIEAQRELQRLKDEDAAFIQRRDTDDFKWFMQDKRGRRIMYKLLADTGVFRNPFVVGHQDLTAYNTGAMGIGQKFFADINEFCPEHYETMLKERKDDNTTRNKR